MKWNTHWPFGKRKEKHFCRGPIQKHPQLSLEHNIFHFRQWTQVIQLYVMDSNHFYWALTLAVQLLHPKESWSCLVKELVMVVGMIYSGKSISSMHIKHSTCLYLFRCCFFMPSIIFSFVATSNVQQNWKEKNKVRSLSNSKMFIWIHAETRRLLPDVTLQLKIPRVASPLSYRQWLHPVFSLSLSLSVRRVSVLWQCKWQITDVRLTLSAGWF